MKQFPRSDKQIAQAKKAQSIRLGQSGAHGKRKKCSKGKSCGASCIANYKLCMVDLTWVGVNALGSVRDKLMEREKPKKPKNPEVPGTPELKPDTKKGPPIMPIFGVENQPLSPSKFKFSEVKGSQL